MKCEYCGEKEVNSFNNQGDKVCNDCWVDSSIKCNYCDDVASYKSQVHSSFYFCDNDKCKDNYFYSYCIEDLN